MCGWLVVALRGVPSLGEERLIEFEMCPLSPPGGDI